MRASIATTALCIATTLWAADGRAQTHPVAFGIAGIEAKLFYENTGRFSANIIDNPKIKLWNLPEGEGVVEGPSNNTLVVVKLIGPAKGFGDGLVLRLVARTERDTLLDREIDVGDFNSAGNFYAPFWLEDTGCQPVIIEVELTLGDERRSKTTHIPFACGE
jgi:hypothetical protein